MSSHIEKRKQTFIVRDSEVTVFADARVDDQSGKILSDLQLDNQAVKLAFDQFRVLNHFITPSEIVHFRERYGLSQRALAKLIGIGSATITRYEQGSLPTESINNLLQEIINDDNAFKNLVNKNGERLSIREQKLIMKRVSSQQSDTKKEALINLYQKRTESNVASINNGFKKFDFEKFKNMVIFFVKNNSHLSKEKLNRLLFYSDFDFFSAETVSMSGVTYSYDYFGPAPVDLELLYMQLRDENVLVITTFLDDRGETLGTDAIFDTTLFDAEELKVLKKVDAKFKNLTVSHN